MNILRIPPSITSRPSKSILAKSKFYLKNWSFTQATKDNSKEILKIKKVFSKLSPDKIIEIQNIVNKDGKKSKPKINITIKRLSRKQIIILISRENINVVILQANVHIYNIKRLLKTIKSNISADFICSNNKGVIITTNKRPLHWTWTLWKNISKN